MMSSMTMRRRSGVTFVTFTQSSLKTSTTCSPRFAHPTPLSRLARVSAGLVAFVAASAPVVARAEADTFGVGTGRDGGLTVNSPGAVINAYTRVSASAAAGATSVTVAVDSGLCGWTARSLPPDDGDLSHPSFGKPKHRRLECSGDRQLGACPAHLVDGDSAWVPDAAHAGRERVLVARAGIAEEHRREARDQPRSKKTCVAASDARCRVTR